MRSGATTTTILLALFRFSRSANEDDFLGLRKKDPRIVRVCFIKRYLDFDGDRERLALFLRLSSFVADPDLLRERDSADERLGLFLFEPSAFFPSAMFISLDWSFDKAAELPLPIKIFRVLKDRN